LKIEKAPQSLLISISNIASSRKIQKSKVQEVIFRKGGVNNTCYVDCQPLEDKFSFHLWNKGKIIIPACYSWSLPHDSYSIVLRIAAAYKT
jgi:hypothetical protein